MLTTANCRSVVKSLSCLLGQAHWRFLDILCSIHVLPQTCQAFIRPYPSRWGHDMLRLLRAFHQHMFYVPSTYVLRPINISSTPHQHMFCASSTYVLRLINICSTFINISSTSHLRLINVSSTSHLRGTLKRNESMFHLSPNQVLLAAFSCTKQVDGKPKQLAWACHLLAKSLPSTCHLRAIYLPSTCEVLANPLPSPCEIPACLFLSFS